MIIDMHTHTFPDSIAEKTLSLLGEKAGITPKGDGTESGLIAEMGLSGTDISIALPVATRVEQVEKINRKSKNTDKIIYGGAFHPDLPDFCKEIDYLKGAGFKCIKFHPEYQSFFISNKKYYPLYEALSASGLYVIFHAGEDEGYRAPFHSSPSEFDRLCRDFPSLNMVLGHYGSYNMWDDVLNLLGLHKNLYLDTAFCYNRISESMFMKILKKFGSEKILYATDWPWESQVNTLSMLEAFDIPKSDLDLIIGGNAKRILKL